MRANDARLTIHKAPLTVDMLTVLAYMDYVGTPLPYRALCGLGLKSISTTLAALIRRNLVERTPRGNYRAVADAQVDAFSQHTER